MTISSGNNDPFFLKYQNILSKLSGDKIKDFTRIHQGFNSRVYRLTGEKENYLAKFYSHQAGEQRSRQNNEYSSLRLLWQNGVRIIPRPIISDTKKGIALYKFIAGTKYKYSRLSWKEIDELVFILTVINNSLSDKVKSKIPQASEACFSLFQIERVLEIRFRQLINLPNTKSLYPDMKKMLRARFLPLQKELMEKSAKQYLRLGIRFNEELRRKNKILSPSDFGFHNCLKRETGEMAVVDFEHFGWDDPAKTVSDFLLHPRMKVKTSLKKRFLQEALKNFDFDGKLLARLKIVYPLHALKWCLILLNEFIPSNLLRRNFAAPKKGDENIILKKQLIKAVKLLNYAKAIRDNFPYAG